ncbi:DNA topoisomerase [Fusobacterium necrophorum]|uniref:Topo IA-type catalytic domain-containing protein n=2 Tax=Fusobacterium necrophorum TaxID=859 RepID=A0AB73BVC4_9FUSO|nr:DNA topoisomerase [Fusobacterium necrophorum]KDE62580.1 hypothetical protein FUSO3_07545 [Fusobacterium necrophorum BL]KDE66055.1 hypothetical protein FUSO4_05400 [Fusobacterium necrophorum DJ-1]KDE68453.1 hypothetical protein FUSO7_13145 [Fusobacterium necrophorum BFTR-2]KDE71881.1 hypothetical protein FUSO8_07060 [Fusobacterium necrophorum DJ-2]
MVADWLIGMNISRLYSCLYKQNYSVGRVQIPTFAMIVKREDEIAAEQLSNLVGDKIEIKKKRLQNLTCHLT